MTTQTVSSGVISSGLSLEDGEVLRVLGGGEALATTVRSGAKAYVSSGGTDSCATILGGGGIYVLSGGIDLATTVDNGGKEIVSAGGVVAGGTILAGGVLEGDGVIGGSPNGVFFDFGLVSGLSVGNGALVVESGGSCAPRTLATPS